MSPILFSIGLKQILNKIHAKADFVTCKSTKLTYVISVQLHAHDHEAVYSTAGRWEVGSAVLT